jgi:hypothetical protein
MKTRYVIPLFFLITSFLGVRVMFWLYKARVEQLQLEPGLAKFFSIIGLLMFYVVVYGVIFTVIPVVGWGVARFRGNQEAEIGFRYCIIFMLICWTIGLMARVFN